MNAQAVGIFLIVMAILFSLGERLPFAGHLPGDISFHGKRVEVIVPIGTCILVSVLLSLILGLIGRR